MKKNLGFLFLIVIFFCFQGVGFADEYYSIKNYDVKVDVAEDNTYAIRETIDVEFSQARHGIFRNIPVRQYGYSHKISDIRVYDPKTGESYQVDQSYGGSELTLKIGDPDTYVDGRQSYRIEYVYDGGNDRIDAYDEFYYNLIGTEWNTTIETATFTVTMPKNFDPARVNFTSGTIGTTASDKVRWTVDGLVVRGEVFNLTPHEGVTMALSLPRGYYTGISEPYTLVWLIVLAGILLIVFIGALRIRNGNFRRNRIVPVLSFYPPDDLNPAEMAYIYDEEQLGNEKIASLIVYWASKGYLRIVEDEKPGLFGSKEEVYFERLAEAHVVPDGYERSLFIDLFAHGFGDIVRIEDLKNEFYEDLNATRGLIRDRYRDEREILENKFQYGIIGVSFLVMAISTFLLAPYTQVLLGVPFIGALIPTGVFLLIFWLIPFGLATRRTKGSSVKKGANVIRKFIFIFVVGQFFFVSRLIFSRFRFSGFAFSNLMIYMLIVFVLYIVTMFAIGKVKRYTPFAQDVLNRVHGFKNFLETAKLDKLHMLFEENPEYFYDMLPYVMIFGLTEIWDGYMQMISVSGPNWYVSNRPFHAYYMMNTVNHSFAQMSAVPQRSSSGGGSVGGGGGGGGGGSW